MQKLWPKNQKAFVDFVKCTFSDKKNSPTNKHE